MYKKAETLRHGILHSPIHSTYEYGCLEDNERFIGLSTYSRPQSQAYTPSNSVLTNPTLMVSLPAKSTFNYGISSERQNQQLYSFNNDALNCTKDFEKLAFASSLELNTNQSQTKALWRSADRSLSYVRYRPKLNCDLEEECVVDNNVCTENLTSIEVMNDSAVISNIKLPCINPVEKESNMLSGSKVHDLFNDNKNTKPHEVCDTVLKDFNVFTCGGCTEQFGIINHLHQHILCHTSGGSYKYVHSLRTAYPTFDTVCVSTQTGSDKKQGSGMVSNDSDFDEDGHRETVPYNLSLETDTYPLDREQCSGSADNNWDSDLSWDESKSPKQARRLSKRTVEHNKSITNSGNKLSRKKIKLSKVFRKGLTQDGKVDKDRHQTETDRTITADNIYEGNQSTIPVSTKSRLDVDPMSKQRLECRFDIRPTSSRGNVLSGMEHADNIQTCGTCSDETETVDLGHSGERKVRLRSSEDFHKLKKKHKFKKGSQQNNNNTQKKSHQCDICGKSYLTRKPLENHKSKEHSEKPMENEHNEKPLENHKSKEHTGKHLENHKSEDQSEKPLENHKIKDHIEKPLKNYKSKEHSGKQVIKTHRTQECKWCCEVFDGRKSLRDHLEQCESKDTFQCYICDEIMYSRGDLKQHLVIHRNDEDLTCKVCKKKLLNEAIMQTHAKSHKLSKSKQCERCGKAFYYQSLLTKHMTHCKDERSYECPNCLLMFKTPNALKHHSSVHNENRPFMCHICGFAAKKLYYLKRHIRSHTGEKPYKCPICGMRFAALNGLDRHNKGVHANKKPCICTFCGKGFSSNWNLRTHERQHTGDTPYKCEYCGMGFKQNVLVKLHIKSHHPVAAAVEVTPGTNDDQNVPSI